MTAKLNTLPSCSTAAEPARFRDALGHFATGITVISSLDDGEPVGFTCQSFYSVSVSPPLVSFSVKASSFSYPRIRRAGRFAVNILSAEQEAISNLFARQGADKWKGLQWQASPLGNPIVPGSLRWLDCEIHAEHEAGDHLIVIGEVKALNTAETQESRPLLYFRGQYCGLSELAHT